MADYRSMYDSEYLGSWDLKGREVTVTIERVVAGSLTGHGGKKTKKPIIYFEGKEKGFVSVKTNSKIIAGMYGEDVDGWVGKRITLFVTTTMLANDIVDCIRVRPTIPSAA